MSPPRPVIVLPGNPGTTLVDLYPVDPEELWAQHGGLFGAPSHVKQLDRVRVHPDEPRHDLHASGGGMRPARIRPLNPFGRPYVDLVDTLRREIRGPYDPVPVFPFGYDWRVATGLAADDLGAFIDEVLRTSHLLPEYRADPVADVDLVAHSSGGLVVARYLARCQQRGTPSRVRRVVSLGSALKGTPEAAYKLVEDYKERHAARTLPSVYELMPWYAGAYEADPGQADLTKPHNWPGSVRGGLDQYCLKVQSEKKGPQFLLDHLQAMTEHRAALDGLDLDANGPLPEGRRGWLAIAGIGETTRVRVRITRRAGQPWFETLQSDAGAWTGDGTVAFYGAVPPFLAPANVVCVSDDDIELGERLSWVGLGELLGAASLHVALAMMNAVQRIAVAFLRDAPLAASLEARRPPGVAHVDWPAWLAAK